MAGTSCAAGQARMLMEHANEAFHQLLDVSERHRGIGAGRLDHGGVGTLAGPVLQVGPAAPEDHQAPFLLLPAHGDANRVGIGYLIAVGLERVRPWHPHVPPGQGANGKPGPFPGHRMAGDQPGHLIKVESVFHPDRMAGQRRSGFTYRARPSLAGSWAGGGLERRHPRSADCRAKRSRTLFPAAVRVPG